MSRLDRYTESLVEEGLKDAAETFFGVRKSLEDEIARFEARVEELRGVGEIVAGRCAAMAGLLPDQSGLDSLWQTLGVPSVDTEAVSLCCRTEPEPLRPSLGLTRKIRYARTLYKAYTLWATAVHEYLDGVYRDDPEVSGKKVKTVHYRGLVSWCEALNEKIVQVNRHHSPSEAMQFAKKMDVNVQSREKVAGASLHYTLDQDMAFKHIDFTATGLPAWPELPAPSGVQKKVLRFAADQYGAHPKKAWGNLRKLAVK